MEGPIKKTVTTDPSTGETTFRASWSGKEGGISRGRITPKPTQRTVAARQAARQTSAPATKETSGERVAVAFKSPTPASVVKNKPEIKSSQLPDKKVTPTLSRRDIMKIKIDKDNEDLKKNYPEIPIEKAREKRYKERTNDAEKRAKENRKFYPVGNPKGKSNRDSACRNC